MDASSPSTKLVGDASGISSTTSSLFTDSDKLTFGAENLNTPSSTILAISESTLSSLIMSTSLSDFTSSAAPQTFPTEPGEKKKQTKEEFYSILTAHSTTVNAQEVRMTTTLPSSTGKTEEEMPTDTSKVDLNSTSGITSIFKIPTFSPPTESGTSGKATSISEPFPTGAPITESPSISSAGKDFTQSIKTSSFSTQSSPVSRSDGSTFGPDNGFSATPTLTVEGETLESSTFPPDTTTKVFSEGTHTSSNEKKETTKAPENGFKNTPRLEQILGASTERPSTDIFINITISETPKEETTTVKSDSSTKSESDESPTTDNTFKSSEKSSAVTEKILPEEMIEPRWTGSADTSTTSDWVTEKSSSSSTTGSAIPSGTSSNQNLTADLTHPSTAATGSFHQKEEGEPTEKKDFGNHESSPTSFESFPSSTTESFEVRTSLPANKTVEGDFGKENLPTKTTLRGNIGSFEASTAPSEETTFSTGNIFGKERITSTTKPVISANSSTESHNSPESSTGGSSTLSVSTEESSGLKGATSQENSQTLKESTSVTEAEESTTGPSILQTKSDSSISPESQRFETETLESRTETSLETTTARPKLIDFTDKNASTPSSTASNVESTYPPHETKEAESSTVSGFTFSTTSASNLHAGDLSTLSTESSTTSSSTSMNAESSTNDLGEELPTTTSPHLEVTISSDLSSSFFSESSRVATSSHSPPSPNEKLPSIFPSSTSIPTSTQTIVNKVTSETSTTNILSTSAEINEENLSTKQTIIATSTPKESPTDDPEINPDATELRTSISTESSTELSINVTAEKEESSNSITSETHERTTANFTQKNSTLVPAGNGFEHSTADPSSVAKLDEKKKKENFSTRGLPEVSTISIKTVDETLESEVFETTPSLSTPASGEAVTQSFEATSQFGSAPTSLNEVSSSKRTSPRGQKDEVQETTSSNPELEETTKKGTFEMLESSTQPNFSIEPTGSENFSVEKTTADSKMENSLRSIIPEGEEEESAAWETSTGTPSSPLTAASMSGNFEFGKISSSATSETATQTVSSSLVETTQKTGSNFENTSFPTANLTRPTVNVIENGEFTSTGASNAVTTDDSSRTSTGSSSSLLGSSNPMTKEAVKTETSARTSKLTTATIDIDLETPQTSESDKNIPSASLFETTLRTASPPLPVEKEEASSASSFVPTQDETSARFPSSSIGTIPENQSSTRMPMAKKEVEDVQPTPSKMTTGEEELTSETPFVLVSDGNRIPTQNETFSNRTPSSNGATFEMENSTTFSIMNEKTESIQTTSSTSVNKLSSEGPSDAKMQNETSFNTTPKSLISSSTSTSSEIQSRSTSMRNLGGTLLPEKSSEVASSSAVPDFTLSTLTALPPSSPESFTASTPSTQSASGPLFSSQATALHKTTSGHRGPPSATPTEAPEVVEVTENAYGVQVEETTTRSPSSATKTANQPTETSTGAVPLSLAPEKMSTLQSTTGTETSTTEKTSSSEAASTLETTTLPESSTQSLCAKASCHELAVCEETTGKCSCREGFEGDGVNGCSKKASADCLSLPSLCSSHGSCDVTTRSCKCDAGYIGDGYSCEPHPQDCVLRPNLCGPEAICMGRRCQCLPGFTGDGVKCVSIHERASNCTQCDSNAHCVGGTCACNVGYFGNGLCCVPDPLDCVHFTGICHPHAVCDAESRQCKCSSGYLGNGISCFPQRSCRTDASVCSPHAICLPTGTCVCRHGFDGDGHICAAVGASQKLGLSDVPTSSCVVPCDEDTQLCISGECICKHGFKAVDGGRCDDVDECAEGTDSCDRLAKCSNTRGSHVCTCPDGFIGDGTSCIPHVNSGKLSVYCETDGMTLVLGNDTEHFEGRMFVKGQAENPHCSKTFTSLVNSHKPYIFKVSFEHCDVNLLENHTLASTVVVQKHAMFITTKADSYDLRCSYPIGTRNVESKLNVSELSTASTLTDAKNSPVCKLTVTNHEEQFISSAVVGDFLRLSLEVIPNNTFTIVPRNCFAVNIENGERYTLTDESGCAIDENLFPQWTSVTPARTRVVFRTFKWPDSSMIRFQCDCAPCVGKCPQPDCMQKEVDAFRFRRHSASDDEAEASETVVMSGVQKLAVSSIIAVKDHAEEAMNPEEDGIVVHKWYRESFNSAETCMSYASAAAVAVLAVICVVLLIAIRKSARLPKPRLGSSSDLSRRI
ncbi:unnamed protein product [Caenorhabditis auriculariae]|uniref:Uncharacterized protein n=1 Tax=Caenorhabditis auriculariae TaxID=2777116 RepID=A0A8S1GZD9_9PELO|nr:unnamed protein product [Caenorhabditis auriculariae]